MRKLAKVLAFIVALVIIMPIALPIFLAGPWDKNDKAFQLGSQSVSLFPGVPGDYIRRAFYSVLFLENLLNSSFGFGTIFAQRDSSIGNCAYIGAFCNVGRCAIGNDVLLGSNVVIASPSAHNFESMGVPIRHQGGDFRKIKVGDDVWIGNSAIIMADVAKGCVIAAGSVVVSECEANGIYGGNPARLIRPRGPKHGCTKR